MLWTIFSAKYMEKFTLKADKRVLMGRDTNALRADSKIPGVVYGAGIEPANVTVDRVSFVKTYRKTGTSGLIDLAIGDEKTIPVLIQEFTQHPVSNFVTHIDFRAVDLNKEIDAVIQLHFIGESHAVKGLGGTLLINTEELEVSALPTALVASIDVDISVLADFETVIRVKDIVLPEGVMVPEDSLEQTVAGVSAPRTSAQMEALEESVDGDVAAVAVEGAKAAEGEEGDEAAKEEKSK